MARFDSMGSLLAALRERRVDRMGTLEELAKRLNVSTSAMGFYETAQRRPDVETFRRWLGSLDYDDREVDEIVKDFKRLSAEEQVGRILEENRGNLSERDREMIIRMIDRSWE